MAATQDLLLKVSQAKKGLIDQWVHGVFVERSSGETLGDLRLRVTSDRWKLAYDCRRRGNRLMSSEPPLYRDAISRYYYAMYHAMRAITFLSYGGDDFQKHEDLPANAPSDFRDHEIWANTLKNARELRNRADYDPYPKTNAPWRAEAEVLQQQASALLNRCRSYLEARGVPAVNGDVDAAGKVIRDRLRHAAVPVVDVDVRHYPQETAFIVLVEEGYLHQAAAIGTNSTPN